MQGLYKFLIGTDIFIGVIIVLLILLQKSTSEGLIAQTTNNFNSSSSVNPGSKITRIAVILFFINSFLLVVVKGKIERANNPKVETVQETAPSLPTE